jgi:hypothetical protein
MADISGVFAGVDVASKFSGNGNALNQQIKNQLRQKFTRPSGSLQDRCYGAMTETNEPSSNPTAS